MKKILPILATLALVALQALSAQATPLEPLTRSLEKRPTVVLAPDAASLLNQLTATSMAGGSWVDAAVDPLQDDTTPPRITFLPPTLVLFPPPFGASIGNIVSISFDAEFPFIVPFGAASAFGNGFNVLVNDLVTFFDIVQIQLPSGQIELGIGFIAAAQFVGFYDPFFPVCPCGGLDIFVLDFAGNTAAGLAPVVVVSF